MTVVGAALVLGLLVLALIKWKVVRPVAAVVCILFGLVLGTTPVGGPVNQGLTTFGRWLTVQVQRL